MNPSENKDKKYYHIEKNELKPLDDQAKIIGLITKKLGKNGMLEVGFIDEEFSNIHSVNVFLSKGKLTIYTE